MGFTAKILGRPRVLAAEFSSGESYALRLDGEPLVDLHAARAEAGGKPIVVVACGYGVLSRDASEELTAKVTAPNGGFVWRREGGTLCFSRRSQLEPLAELRPVAMTCAASMEQAEEAAAGVYAREVGLRTLLRPSANGSLLSSLLARRIRLPVLGALLSLLAVNAAVSPSVHGREQAARLEKATLEKRTGKAGDFSHDRSQAVAEWGRTLPRSYAWLMDRAAIGLPGSIVLLSLTVQPSLKRIEQGRVPLFSEREMVITGLSPDSGSVSEYAAALDSLNVARAIRLSTVEYDREKGLYNFRINLEL